MSFTGCNDIQAVVCVGGFQKNRSGMESEGCDRTRIERRGSNADPELPQVKVGINFYKE